VNGHLSRLAVATVAALTMGTALISTAFAAAPTIDTWSNHVVSVDYFECGQQAINGDWTISHHLTTFYNKDGSPARDIEKIDFVGAFVNPANGASIADSGQIVFFDTLAPDYSYLATVMNVVRKSAYLHAAGRNDFDSGKSVGMDNWDAGVDGACAALGA
jgi:hypothetical protein